MVASMSAVLPSILSVSDTLQLIGLVIFFGGVATGMLLVFTDRHGYDHPISPKLVGGLIFVGIAITGIGWLTWQVGF